MDGRTVDTVAMTLGRLASLVLAVGSLVGAIASGSLAVGLGVLAAPMPALAVLGLRGEWADWAIPELLAGRHTDGAVEADLDAALRAPLDAPRLDDSAFFVPGCPPLTTPGHQPEQAVTQTFRIGPPDDAAPPSTPSSR